MDIKEAVEHFKNYIIWNQKYGFPRGKNDEAIETILAELENSKKETQQVLNDYQELGKDYHHLECELEKKEKIIDELVKTTVTLREKSNEDCFIPRSYRDINDCIKTNCADCIIEYFKRIF